MIPAANSDVFYVLTSCFRYWNLLFFLAHPVATGEVCVIFSLSLIRVYAQETKTTTVSQREQFAHSAFGTREGPLGIRVLLANLFIS